jgi:transcriptional regulator with XRE-family HTH domain
MPMTAKAATFGQRLRAAREAAGLSQARLADAAGMHPNAVARLERGERHPSWHTVQLLATALDISTEQLRDG